MAHLALHVCPSGDQPESRLLPNITLGYNLYETHFRSRLTSKAMLGLPTGGGNTVPNYSCGGKNSLVAILEGAESDISVHISTMSRIYKIPQVCQEQEGQQPQGRSAGTTLINIAGYTGGPP